MAYNINHCRFSETVQDIKRIRDTMLDILILPLEVIISSLRQDAEFYSDGKKMIEQWRPCCSTYLTHRI